MTTIATLNLTDWESGDCFFGWKGELKPETLKQLVEILQAVFPTGETPRQLNDKETP